MDKFEVEEWLNGAYDQFSVKASDLEIPCYKRPYPSAKNRRLLFEQSFYGRDSLQHGWLKWFAINYLSFQAEYEVEVFIPPVLGKYGNGAGRLLPRGHQYTSVPGSRFQRADVAGFDTLIEVGVTAPRSLVEPLWCYAVKKVIWIPFQFDNINEDWSQFNHMNDAFLIQRVTR